MCSITYLQQLIVNATEDLFCLWYKDMSYQTLLHFLYLNTSKYILIVSDENVYKYKKPAVFVNGKAYFHQLI